MKTIRYISSSVEETNKLGFDFAEKIQRGDVLTFYGELGAGKTEFIKGICEYLKVEEIVNSPTFTIINQYIGELDEEEVTIYHLDLYRISNINELKEIGFDECIHSADSIKLIEWAEKADKRIDNTTYEIHFNTDEKDENFREITILF